MPDDNPVFYLLPAPLSTDGWDLIPQSAIQMYHNLDYFIAEQPKSVRRFLSQIEHPLSQKDIKVSRFNKKSKAREIDSLMSPLKQNTSIAYVSEAGSAAIADPGSRLVQWAHRKSIEVNPFPGPISLMLALAASGLNGQNFHFHGYLPIDKDKLKRELKSLQKSTVNNHTTHIFIETPYRSKRTAKSLLNNLHNDINLCIAMNLTMESQFIKTQSIRVWKSKKNIANRVDDNLCVFLFAAAGAGEH